MQEIEITRQKQGSYKSVAYHVDCRQNFKSEVVYENDKLNKLSKLDLEHCTVISKSDGSTWLEQQCMVWNWPCTTMKL